MEQSDKQGQAQEHELPIIGEHLERLEAWPSTEEELAVLHTGQEISRRQLEVLETAARGIIERTGTFLAIIFAILAFGDHFPPSYITQGTFALRVLTLIALVIFVTALALAGAALSPLKFKHYTYNIDAQRQELQKMYNYKARLVFLGNWCFLLGLLTFVILIGWIILTA